VGCFKALLFLCWDALLFGHDDFPVDNNIGAANSL
jgi:hypothetical protein